MSRVAARTVSALALAFAAIAPIDASAQAPAEASGATQAERPAERPEVTPQIAFGAWAGMAHRSPAGLWGTTSGRDLSMLAFRFAWTLYHDSGVAVDYTLDFVPAAYLSRQQIVIAPSGACSTDGVCEYSGTFASAGAAFGFGMAPAGVELRFRPERRLQPFVGVSAGMLHFSERVPSPRGSRVNFTANLGGGLQIVGPDHYALVLGYKLFHLSNAGHAVSNPGVDNNLLYVGIVRK